MKTEQFIQKCQTEVSGGWIEERAAAMAEEFALRLSQQGMSIESYYLAKNTTEQELMGKLRVKAEEQLKRRAVFEQIAQQEGLEASEEEVEQELRRLCLHYPVGLDEIKRVITGEQMESLKRDIILSKAARIFQQK